MQEGMRGLREHDARNLLMEKGDITLEKGDITDFGKLENR